MDSSCRSDIMVHALSTLYRTIKYAMHINYIDLIHYSIRPLKGLYEIKHGIKMKRDN